MGLQGLEASELKGLGPLRLEAQWIFAPVNQGNALDQDLAVFIECKNMFLQTMEDQKGLHKRGIHDQGDFWNFPLETTV